MEAAVKAQDAVTALAQITHSNRLFRRNANSLELFVRGLGRYVGPAFHSDGMCRRFVPAIGNQPAVPRLPLDNAVLGDSHGYHQYRDQTSHKPDRRPAKQIGCLHRAAAQRQAPIAGDHSVRKVGADEEDAQAGCSHPAAVGAQPVARTAAQKAATTELRRKFRGEAGGARRGLRRQRFEIAILTQEAQKLACWVHSRIAGNARQAQRRTRSSSTALVRFELQCPADRGGGGVLCPLLLLQGTRRLQREGEIQLQEPRVDLALLLVHHEVPQLVQ